MIKKRKISKLNEALLNVNKPDEINGDMPIVMSAAKEESDKIDELNKERFKEVDKEKEAFIKKNNEQPKIDRTAAQKKMHLSESLFEDEELNEKVIESPADLDTDEQLNAYHNVSEHIFELIADIIENELSAQEMETEVPGYNAEWCPEEFDEKAHQRLMTELQAFSKMVAKTFFDTENIKNESLKEELENDDGWGESVEEICGQFMDNAERIIYEIRNGRRGSYGISGDTIEDLVSDLEDLSSDIQNAIYDLEAESDELNESLKEDYPAGTEYYLTYTPEWGMNNGKFVKEYEPGKFTTVEFDDATKFSDDFSSKVKEVKDFFNKDNPSDDYHDRGEVRGFEASMMSNQNKNESLNEQMSIIDIDYLETQLKNLINDFDGDADIAVQYSRWQDTVDNMVYMIDNSSVGNTNECLKEDLKITEESDLTDFNFWEGAAETVKYLTDDEIRQIADELERDNPNGMTKTEVNDFFWFEDDTIAQMLGYTDFEELMEDRG